MKISSEKKYGRKKERNWRKRNSNNDKMEIEMKEGNTHRKMVLKSTDLHRGHYTL